MPAAAGWAWRDPPTPPAPSLGPPIHLGPSLWNRAGGWGGGRVTTTPSIPRRRRTRFPRRSPALPAGKCSPACSPRPSGCCRRAPGAAPSHRVPCRATVQCRAMASSASAASIRACRPEDCARVMRLIQELAEFEKVPEQIKINDQGLCKDGFCEDPFYKCLVAEVQPEDQSKGHIIVGYALYFFTYSTWKGRNIYMEDLYVIPEYRGKGIGKKLMSKVAQVGVEKGCTQMKFSVLDWNRPAIDFYLSKGAVDLTATEGWHVFRFEADALRQLALGEPGE